MVLPCSDRTSTTRWNTFFFLNYVCARVKIHLIQDSLLQHYTRLSMVIIWSAYPEGHTVNNLLRVALQDHPVGRNERTHASLGATFKRTDEIRLSSTANSCEA